MKDAERYSYNRFGSKGQRVGQAALDMMQKDHPNMTVEELMEGLSEKFLVDFEKCVQDGMKKYEGKFHVFVLTKKDLGQFGVSNVVRNFFINRETAPEAAQMMIDYPSQTKTLYEIDPAKGDFQIKWTLPGYEECKSIAKNPQIYDPQLVKWIGETLDTKALIC